jgi:hypothetical protein
LDRKLSQGELDEICQYLLEEIAGLFYLYFDLGYNIDIYPRTNMEIVEDIYANKFLGLTKKLKYNWTKQSWIQVDYPNL